MRLIDQSFGVNLWLYDDGTQVEEDTETGEFKRWEG